MAFDESVVLDTIASKLNVKKDRLSNDASFKDDLGADSLELADLIMEFEDKFDIKISEEDGEKLLTVGDALSYIKQKVEADK
ncbi:MAG: acyl carrier protein [Candidatus Coatesbacteria bacterium]|nr:MAG: acyl carrier protein [Candidatus Coatesbacteria bacterium]